METILGLDLGTNSIGWAIRDISEHENQIIDKGVLVFDKGVATVEGREQPKVKERTEARGKRRNYQAEKYRKYVLLECLIAHKMCPLTILELNEWRHYKKGVGREYPQSEKFIQWLRFDFNGDGKPDFEQFGFSKHENCYLFRWLAVSEKEENKNIFNNNPQLLGRVFYQLAQRRGFRKGDDDNETDLIENGRPKKDNTGKVIKGEVEVVGIKVIDNLIKEKYKTLGAALYWGQKNNELESINSNRIRNRFTYRDYYANEIDLIFENLKFVFENLEFDKKPDSYKIIRNAIIDQRPLRSQKGLVGYCTLDNPLKSKTGIYYKPGKKRIPLSHPLYEEFRTWHFINNLKIEPSIGVDKFEFIQKNVVPLFNRASDFYLSNKTDKNGKVTKGLKVKIKELGGKVLSKHDNDLTDEDEGTRFNANTFLHRLEKMFGENWKELLRWDETLKGVEGKRNYLRAEDIWHLFYDALLTKKQTENFAEKVIPILQKHFPQIVFNESDFQSVKKDFDNGYASLSASSIRKILPYLKRGLIYAQAVFVANLEKVFDRKLDDETLSDLLNDFKEINRKHQEDKEVYGMVNNLISDRLFYRDRLSMGDNYILDEYDYKDIDEKIKETFKTKDWNKKNKEQKEDLKKKVADNYILFLRQPLGINKSKTFHKIYRIEDELKKLLIEKYKANENHIKNYLWHPSEQEKYPPAYVKADKNGEVIKNAEGEEIYFLGDPNPISRGLKNPMAMKTLQHLKKLLNHLLQNCKIDAQTKVVVEIARELNDANRRRAIERLNRLNKTKKDDLKKRIEECFTENNISNRSISESLLDRYELWVEQNGKCIYCAHNIKCTDVINGTAQIEHTIPAKISNCSELYNLTIAHPECNAKKAKRIPFEWKDNYDLILGNVKFIYVRFKQHEENYERTFDRVKHAKDKETKDKAIQDRHFEKELMKYWRKKYETFILEEVTNQFRRQQLTDTQIITKYSLPYLKTVFNSIDVQKGIITSKFRKIYEIEPKKVDKKDRTIHSHHAVDAALLTLIPPASIRDNILKEYNQAIDDNTLNTYQHPKPRNWNNFHQSMITSMKNEIIINYVSEDRILKETFKYQRKRGEFVKNKNGKKIMQRGDATRGQLHDESIFGMIKIPQTEIKEGRHRLKITDGKLTFKQNEKRGNGDGNLFVVKKIKITDIKNIDDFEKLIIDPNLGSYLKNEFEKRMKDNNFSFEKALSQPIYAFGKEKDKNGNLLQPIRHLRCKSHFQNPVEIKETEKAFESKYIYKRTTYANNGAVPICAFYQGYIDSERIRILKSQTILEMSNAFHFSKNKMIVEPFVLKSKKVKKIKVDYQIDLFAVLKQKQHVIFFKESESLISLKEMYQSEMKQDKMHLLKRIYTIVKFEDGFVFFKYHLCSMDSGAIEKEMESDPRKPNKKGANYVDFENPFLSLKLSQGALNMAIEGKHFKLEMDGKIDWKFL
jgi:CRISPR-associated endonuclease Csn1